MNVITKEITIKTKHENQMIDLSDDINKEIKSSGLKDGIVTVFTRHSTGAITTIEYEPGLEKDFPAMLKRIAPTMFSMNMKTLGTTAMGAHM